MTKPNKTKGDPPPASTLRGDITGGLISAVVAIPGNVAFGLLAFAPLGPEYIGVGVLAGMMSSAIASAIAGMLGRTRIMISGPEAPSALLIAGMMATLSASGQFDQLMADNSGFLLAAAFVTVFFSGLFQVLFGVLQMGVLIKFISYPVIAGIVNGTALLIIIGQIGPFLGMPAVGLGELLSNLGNIQWPSAAVAAVTCLLMLFGKKIIKAVPPSILGIFGGTALYFILKAVGLSAGLGDTLGDIPTGFPTLSYATDFVAFVFDSSYRTLLPVILSTAFTIAVIHSVNSLLAVVYLRNLAPRRPNGNLELIGQGVGNIVNSWFGGLPADGHIGRSVVNFEGGGRTKLSVVLSSVLIFCVICFFANIIGLMPKAVVTGVVMAIAFVIADRSIFTLIDNLIHRRVSDYKEPLANFGIMVLVMGVTVAANLVIAVVTGIVISLVVFISQMSRSVIRRIRYGSRFNSRKQRFQEAKDLLSAHMQRIVVLELQGALFFGSADLLAQEVERLADEGAKFVILDFRHLNRIDSTGAKILAQTREQLKRKKCNFYLSYIKPTDPNYSVLKDFGVIEAFGRNGIYSDTSRAFEHCEDVLLRVLLKGDFSKEKVPVERILEYNGFSLKNIGIIRKYLSEKTYKKGEYIVRQGEDGASMFFLEKGSAEVVLELGETRSQKRLLTITPGSIFGEMAIIDGSPRAADIVVTTPAVCRVLTILSLDKLKATHPLLATDLYMILSRLISQRLREANETIAELET